MMGGDIYGVNAEYAWRDNSDKEGREKKEVTFFFCELKRTSRFQVTMITKDGTE